MAQIKPWGSLQWLLPLIPGVTWDYIGCASFEERCVATPSVLSANRCVRKSIALRIADPPNRFSGEIERLTNQFERDIRASLTNTQIVQTELLSSVSEIYAQIDAELDGSESVILDISALPKRFFLFMLRRLLARDSIRNLLVCYTTAGTYPEGALTQNAKPIDALPGFARIGEDGKPTLIVSVGYVAFDINDLIQQAKISNVKFLFPFPPGSPAFRRNWRLLHQLIPDMGTPLEIRRIHALDAFAALEWLKDFGTAANGVLDMVPLGPKPHSLAMGLAYIALGDAAQVLYPQPTTYRSDYSKGVGKTVDGQDAVTAYCLRKDGRNFF